MALGISHGSSLTSRSVQDGTLSPSSISEAQPLQIDAMDYQEESRGVTPEVYYNVTSDKRNSPPPAWKVWLDGRAPHQKLLFKPLVPARQTAPLRWINQRFPLLRQRVLLFICLFFIWSFTFAILLDTSIGPVKVDGIYQPVQKLDCEDSFWLPDNGCGIDGVDCRPFSGSSMAFHCPANCGNIKVRIPHHVGNQSIVGRPLVIGGSIYRGDSYICASAIHAGIIGHNDGGCGVVSRVGQTNSYPSSSINGISSVAVKTYFPLSYKFHLDSEFRCQATDSQWLLPWVSLITTTLVFLYTTSAAIPFFTAFVVGFVHVSYVSDPAPGTHHHRHFVYAHATEESSSRLAIASSRFLPALFCAFIIYKLSVRQTFYKLTAQFEKTALWLGAFWIGAFANHTFEWFPISEVAAQDMEQQYTALAAVFLCVVFFHRMYYLRLEGGLSDALPQYTIFMLAFLLLMVLPDLRVPIHYYVLAILLLPGGSTQTRLSLFYQGLLLGLFVHGIARHGFAPSPQHTPVAPAPMASLHSSHSSEFAMSPALPAPPPIPTIHDPVIVLGNAISNITFSWAPPLDPLVDGISMLVNDVERARRYFGEDGGVSGVVPGKRNDSFLWERGPQAVVDYVRFSFLKNGKALGYSEAGVWFVNGTWSGPRHDDGM